MSVKFEKDSDGIVTLTLDMRGSSMNVRNDELNKAFPGSNARPERQRVGDGGETGGAAE